MQILDDNGSSENEATWRGVSQYQIITPQLSPFLLKYFAQLLV